jgi:hypothetical protein
MSTVTVKDFGGNIYVVNNVYMVYQIRSMLTRHEDLSHLTPYYISLFRTGQDDPKPLMDKEEVNQNEEFFMIVRSKPILRFSELEKEDKENPRVIELEADTRLSITKPLKILKDFLGKEFCAYVPTYNHLLHKIEEDFVVSSQQPTEIFFKE